MKWRGSGLACLLAAARCAGYPELPYIEASSESEPGSPGAGEQFPLYGLALPAALRALAEHREEFSATIDEHVGAAKAAKRDFLENRIMPGLAEERKAELRDCLGRIAARVVLMDCAISILSIPDLHVRRRTLVSCFREMKKVDRQWADTLLCASYILAEVQDCDTQPPGSNPQAPAASSKQALKVDVGCAYFYVTIRSPLCRNYFSAYDAFLEDYLEACQEIYKHRDQRTRELYERLCLVMRSRFQRREERAAFAIPEPGAKPNPQFEALSKRLYAKIRDLNGRGLRAAWRRLLHAGCPAGGDRQ